MKSIVLILSIFSVVVFKAQESPNSDKENAKVFQSSIIENNHYQKNDSIAKRNATIIAKELSQIPAWEFPLRNTSPIKKNVTHTLQQDKNFNYLNDGIVEVLSGTQTNMPNDLTIGFQLGKNKK